MSLIAWWPLNGSIENQGVGNYTTASRSVTYISNGKIGSAASFTGDCSQYIAMTNAPTPSSNFSWSCWIKPTTFTVGTQFILSQGRDYEKYGFNLVIYNGTIQIYAGGNTIYTVQALTINTWYHITLTVNSTTIYAYINGTLVNSYSLPTLDYTYATGGFVIGKMSYVYDATDRYFPFQGYINDVRIYDHCLSADEVKELAQGLILHYPMCMPDGIIGGENLLLGTATIDTAYWLIGSVGNGVGTWYNDDGYYVTITGNTSGNRDVCAQTNKTYNLTNGKIYTASWDAKALASTGVYMLCRCWNRTTSSEQHRLYGGIITNTAWKRFSYTFTYSGASTDALSLQFGLSGNYTSGIAVKNFKLEEGSEATPWTPTPSEIGGDPLTVYDCSGYRHNGTYTAASKPSWDNDSPVGLGSYSFNGSTVDTTSNTKEGAKYISGPCSLETPEALTIAWWGKINTYGRGGIFETTSNTSDYIFATDYSTTAIANWDATFRVYNGSSSVNLYSNIVKANSTWQHNAITFDGANVKCYINGELKQTGALTGTLPTFNGIKIGIERAGGVYRQIDMDMADFRIYATALSATDIERLYKVRTTIDNYGNLLTTSLIESSSIANSSLTKSGLVKAFAFTEEGDTGRVFENGEVKATSVNEFV